MKKKNWLLIAALTAATLYAAAGERKVFPLTESETVYVLVGEAVEYLAPATGEVVSVIPQDDALVKIDSGDKRWVFEAKKGGATAVTARVKDGDKETTTQYKVEVLSDADIPLITTAELNADPKKYMGKMIRLSGKNLGWGVPASGKPVWGERGTKSDWTLEDDTGAVNVTGVLFVDDKNVTVYARIVNPPKGYMVYAFRVVPNQPAMIQDGVKFDLELKNGDNEMKVGQVGRVVVEPSRSESFYYEIEGDAAKVETENRDYLYLRGVKEGEATVKIYLRWWMEGKEDNPFSDIAPEGDKKPVMVIKIKVKAEK